MEELLVVRVACPAPIVDKLSTLKVSEVPGTISRRVPAGHTGLSAQELSYRPISAICGDPAAHADWPRRHHLAEFSHCNAALSFWNAIAGFCLYFVAVQMLRFS
jgi:hypothetical protein